MQKINSSKTVDTYGYFVEEESSIIESRGTAFGTVQEDISGGSHKEIFAMIEL